MNPILKLSFSLLLIFSLSISLSAQKAEKILDDLSIKTNSFDNIKATFAYKMSNKEAGIDELTNGTLLVSGEKYRLNIAGQEIISNGSTLWTYIPDSEEVQINEISEDESFSPSKLLSSYNENYIAKMQDDIIKEGITCYQLKLKPKKEDSNFDYVILHINKELIQLVDFIIYDFDGNVFSYEIKQFITNSEISNDSFNFDTSKFPDVEVIDMR